MAFTRDSEGNDVWVTYRTTSNSLIRLYSVHIEYGEQERDTVLIKKAMTTMRRDPRLS